MTIQISEEEARVLNGILNRFKRAKAKENKKPETKAQGIKRYLDKLK